jgi:hypothetical protein
MISLTVRGDLAAQEQQGDGHHIENLDAARAALLPRGWFVRHSGKRVNGQWAMHAFDATEEVHI